MRFRRVVVIGNTCAGKSTLAAKLAEKLSVQFVDLDGLYWEPNWQPATLSEFRRRVDQATSGNGWVLAGNYSRQRDISWARAEAVVWLDIGLPVIVARILSRSYRRWKSRELLWGTNHDRFWPQLKLWDEKTSLIAWAVRHHAAKRQEYAAAMRDKQWRHIQFQRFAWNADAEHWVRTLRI